MLIAISILTFLILAAFQIMSVGSSSWFTNNTAVELRSDIIKAFSKIEREIKETRPSQISLNAGNVAETLTFRIPEDVDGNNSILSLSGNIEWSDEITYELNNSQQLIRTTSGATIILANNVVSLLFSRPVSPMDLLQVDMIVQRKSESGKQLQDLGQILIKMRN